MKTKYWLLAISGLGAVDVRREPAHSATVAEHDREVLSGIQGHAASIHMNALTPSETESILALCLMASLADGDKHDYER